MKPLKAAHREKKRYLLIRGTDVRKEKIEEAIFDFIGVLGFAEAAPVFIKNSKDGIILAINRESLDKIRASFLMSSHQLDIVRVSGTLQGLKGKYRKT